MQIVFEKDIPGWVDMSDWSLKRSNRIDYREGERRQTIDREENNHGISKEPNGIGLEVGPRIIRSVNIAKLIDPEWCQDQQQICKFGLGNWLISENIWIINGSRKRVIDLDKVLI